MGPLGRMKMGPMKLLKPIRRIRLIGPMKRIRFSPQKLAAAAVHASKALSC